MDPTQDPTQDTSGALDQKAIDAQIGQYNDALSQFNNAVDHYNQIAADPQAAASDVSQAQTNLDNTRAALGQAARAYATTLTQVANQRAANARSAKDPNEQRLWSNEADKASSQADLYGAEADMYQAKTQAAIDAATSRASTALQRANTYAQRVQSQNDASQAQSLLANTRAAQLPALTQSTVQLHANQIQVAQQRANAYVSRVAAQNQVSGSQVDVNEARAQLISGPQAEALLSKAELDAAKAKGLDLTQGATLDKIQAAANLSNARVQQIAANIGKQQVLPYQDKTSPTLDVFQPSTGQVTGVSNPGYVNQTLQGITDTNQAISQIQNQISSGQMTPEDGTALINNLRQALQYKALGVTPDQYVQMQDQQAQLGMGVLNNYMGVLNKGQDVANQFLNTASRVRGLPAGANFSPFSTFGQIAQNVYGPSLQKAQDLISQVQPVSDRFTALQAVSNLAQARDHIAAVMQGNPVSNTDQANPMDTTANPTVSANPTTPQAFVQSGLPEGRAG